MPRFQYLGDEVRVYPTVPITVSPGDVVELDEALDERWALLVPPPAAKKSTAAAGTKDATKPSPTDTTTPSATTTSPSGA